MTQIIHLTTQVVLVNHLIKSDSFIQRLKGLMFSKSLPAGSGLMITPCQQIHTHFMRYALDVIFLDATHTVIHVQRNMQPWRFSKFYKQARYVIEVNAGEAHGVQIGDQLAYQ